MFMIQKHPPQGLPHPEKYSPEFNDFVKQCLTLNPHDRPSALQLLDHPFIKKSQGKIVLAQLVQESMEKIEAYRDERRMLNLNPTTHIVSDASQINIEGDGDYEYNETGTVRVRKDVEDNSIMESNRFLTNDNGTMIVKDTPQKQESETADELSEKNTDKDFGTIVYHEDNVDMGTTKINQSETKKAPNEFSIYMEVYKQYNQKYHTKKLEDELAELCNNLTYDQRVAPDQIFTQKIKDLDDKKEHELKKITTFYNGKIDEIQKIVSTKERLKLVLEELQKNGVELDTIECLKVPNLKQKKEYSRLEINTNDLQNSGLQNQQEYPMNQPISGRGKNQFPAAQFQNSNKNIIRYDTQSSSEVNRESSIEDAIDDGKQGNTGTRPIFSSQIQNLPFKAMNIRDRPLISNRSYRHDEQSLDSHSNADAKKYYILDNNTNITSSKATPKEKLSIANLSSRISKPKGLNLGNLEHHRTTQDDRIGLKSSQNHFMSKYKNLTPTGNNFGLPSHLKKSYVTNIHKSGVVSHPVDLSLENRKQAKQSDLVGEERYSYGKQGTNYTHLERTQPNTEYVSVSKAFQQNPKLLEKYGLVSKMKNGNYIQRDELKRSDRQINYQLAKQLITALFSLKFWFLNQFFALFC